MTEIERKFLLKALPDTSKATETLEYEQGYLPTGGVIRERVTQYLTGPVKYRRAVKVNIQTPPGSPLVRHEFEEALDKATFDLFWPLTVGRRLHKFRYWIPDKGLVWEIDNFLDRDLMILEVELPDDRTEITVPAYLQSMIIREITHDLEFDAYSLAK